jgi:hypothetical protein
VSRNPATSAALNCSTSRSTSTARWRAGSSCIAATSASRMLPRSAARAAGSSRRASGNGCSHGTSKSGTSGVAGSSLAATSPDGSGRRVRPSSAVRQAFVAIR